MNGKTSGAISGAASGAAMGAQIGGGYGAAIGAVVGAIGGLISGGSADAQSQRAHDIALWNNTMRYNNSMNNLTSHMMLSEFNALMAAQTGKLNASLIASDTQYNIDLLGATTEYNNNLLEEELQLVWESADLDIKLLGMQRAIERGQIESFQSASGVQMGVGSLADTIVDQKTQEELDKFIIRHNADIKANQIENAIAQNTWKGTMAMIQTSFEGKKAIASTLFNSKLQAQSIMASGMMDYMAGSQSANNQFNSSMIGLDNSQYAYSQQNTANMMNGLFSAASKYASSYGGNSTDSYVPESTASVSSYTYAQQGHPAWERTNPYLN